LNYTRAGTRPCMRLRGAAKTGSKEAAL